MDHLAQSDPLAAIAALIGCIGGGALGADSPGGRHQNPLPRGLRSKQSEQRAAANDLVIRGWEDVTPYTLVIQNQQRHVFREGVRHKQQRQVIKDEPVILP